MVSIGIQKQIDYSFGLIVYPRKTLRRLSKEKSLTYSLVSYSLFCLLYSVFVFLLYLNNEQPHTTSVWLKFFSQEKYYLYETFFLAPISFLTYIIFAYVVFIIAREIDGKGTFKKTFIVLGFTYSIPLICAFWVPDVILYFVNGYARWNTLVPFYAPVATAWSLVLSILGVKIIHRINWFESVCITVIAMVISNIPSSLVIR